jgi:hypothetical protein
MEHATWGVRDGEADGTREDPGERGLPQAQDAEACDEGGGQPGQVPQPPVGTPGVAEERRHTARAVVRKALSGTMPSVPVASPSRDERDEVLEAARERDEQDGEDKDEGGRTEITGGM